MSVDGSLLNFLDAPVVVGDPEGRVIFVNPAFEQCFDAGGRSVVGQSFAELFAGGGREAFLSAVAEVCSNGETVRFRLKEDGRGYIGVASPITAEDDRVGVIILLSDEPFSLQRLLTLQRELDEPLEELTASLDLLIEGTGGRRNDRFRSAVEVSMAAVERARKWSADFRAQLTGDSGDAAAANFDPVRVVRAVQTRVNADCERAQVHLDVMAPAALPAVVGDAPHLETVLLRMLRDRVEQCDAGQRVSISARAEHVGGEPSVVFTVVAPMREGTAAELRRQRDSIASLGGFHHVCIHSPAGRATSIPIPLAPERA